MPRTWTTWARTSKYLATEDRHWQAAFDAQSSLARTGRHRAVGIAYLLTAVLASEHQLTLVHYDADLDLACEVLSFSGQWAASRCTLP